MRTISILSVFPRQTDCSHKKHKKNRKNCFVVLHLQWMVSGFRVDKDSSSSRAGWVATQLILAPLSSLETGNVKREIEDQVLWLFDSCLVSSWLCPLEIISSSIYHISLAGGLAPVAMHSSSRSSPAAAMMSVEASPIFWMRMLFGASVEIEIRSM